MSERVNVESDIRSIRRKGELYLSQRDLVNLILKVADKCHQLESHATAEQAVSIATAIAAMGS